MNSRFDKLDDKLDKIADRLDEIDKKQTVHSEILQAHHRRSTLLEEDVKPIKVLVYQAVGVGKFIGVLALLATVGTFVLKVLGK